MILLLTVLCLAGPRPHSAPDQFILGSNRDDTQLIEDFRARFNDGEKLKYLFFWGHQANKTGVTASCFSQWYPAPFDIEGHHYPTAEHFMMAEKALLFNDPAIRAQILQAPTPGAAKALGRQVHGYNEAAWLAHRYSIVVRANAAKFAQNPELAEFLQQTGARILVEASPVDRIWGIGLAQDHADINDPNRWQGLNLLGFALMQVRRDA